MLEVQRSRLPFVDTNCCEKFMLLRLMSDGVMADGLGLLMA